MANVLQINKIMNKKYIKSENLLDETKAVLNSNYFSTKGWKNWSNFTPENYVSKTWESQPNRRLEMELKYIKASVECQNEYVESGKHSGGLWMATRDRFQKLCETVTPNAKNIIIEKPIT